MIYLASPYSHEDPDVMDRRFRAACMATARLIKKTGKNVFSPIAHSHSVSSESKLPTDWNYWSKIDEEYLGMADEVHILSLPGHDVSVGVNAEIGIAMNKGLKITFQPPTEEELAILSGADAPVNPKDMAGALKCPSSNVPQNVMLEVGLAMLEGKLKYTAFNWRKTPIQASVYMDALKRHMTAYWEGEDIDKPSGLHHVVKAIATLAILRDAMIHGKVHDDRPPPSPNGWLEDLNHKAREIVERYSDAAKK